jgi:hypothetical protein
MKRIIKYIQHILGLTGFCLLLSLPLLAQEAASDSTAAALKDGKKAVKNTFDGNYLVDNQTVMVPIKGTFEFDFQHRFGLVNNGIQDMFGLYAGATIRLGFSYVPIKNLQIGFGSISDPMQVDGNIKYSIFRQTKDNSMPVSVTWFSNMVVDTRNSSNFATNTDRFSYFHQLIIARKFSDKFSVQVAPNLSHYNSLPGYTDAEGNIQPTMENNHFAIAFSGRYKVTQGTAILLNYDQPITQHPTNNPKPNISFGAEFVTSAHSFQVFFGNYSYIVPQLNNYFNQNDYSKGQYLIGFNISRLWNF